MMVCREAMHGVPTDLKMHGVPTIKPRIASLQFLSIIQLTLIWRILITIFFALRSETSP